MSDDAKDAPPALPTPYADWGLNMDEFPTPLTDKHLKDSEDWVVRETRGGGLHVAAARQIERTLRADLAAALAALQAQIDELKQKLVDAIPPVRFATEPEEALLAKLAERDYRIAELEASVGGEDSDDEKNVYGALEKAQSKLADCVAEIARLREDAERYRRLRTEESTVAEICNSAANKDDGFSFMWGDELDAAVDAARKEQP